MPQFIPVLESRINVNGGLVGAIDQAICQAVVNTWSLPWVGHIVARIGLRIRRARLLIGDPIVNFEWCGRRIRLPLSHELPRFSAIFPHYNQNLGRLASAVSGDLGRPLQAIDVGANVGDTALLLLANGAGVVLCIEGSARYAELLRGNVTDVVGVACEESLVAFAGARAGLVIAESGGTGAVVDGGDAISPVPMKTLDVILSGHADALQSVDLLKIDTDGFDGAIIRQHPEFLQRWLPVTFFEFYFSRPSGMPESLPCPDAGALDLLVDLGYDGMVVFRNTGEAAYAGLLSRDRERVLSMGKAGAFGHYADIVVFHRSRQSQCDACLAEFGFAPRPVEFGAANPANAPYPTTSAAIS